MEGEMRWGRCSVLAVPGTGRRKELAAVAKFSGICRKVF
jgi:hypothetical protein